MTETDDLLVKLRVDARACLAAGDTRLAGDIYEAVGEIERLREAARTRTRYGRPRRRRILGIFVLLVYLVAGCDAVTAPPPPPDTCTWAPEPGHGTAQRVQVRGDSLPAMSETTARGFWGAQPRVSLCYRSEAGSEIDRWVTELGRVTGDQDLVVHLGMNDVLREDWEQIRLDLHRALEAASGARCVAWFTLSGVTAERLGEPYAGRIGAFNSELRALDDDGAYPNLTVYDWDALNQEFPDWTGPDGIHLTAEGTERFGWSLVAAGDSCVPA